MGGSGGTALMHYNVDNSIVLTSILRTDDKKATMRCHAHVSSSVHRVTVAISSTLGLILPVLSWLLGRGIPSTGHEVSLEMWLQGSTYAQPRHLEEVGWLVLRSAAFSPGENPRCSLYRRLSELQDQSGHEAVKKNLYPSDSRVRTRVVQLSWLLGRKVMISHSRPILP